MLTQHWDGHVLRRRRRGQTLNPFDGQRWLVREYTLRQSCNDHRQDHPQASVTFYLTHGPTAAP